MELHFSHASRVLGNKPLPLEATRLVLTGEQARLTQLFAKRLAKLNERGELSVEHERLVDRRPVDMKPSTTIYAPPAKAKVRGTKAVAYDHPLLTQTQRSCQTNTTMGKPLEMKNRVAEEKGQRFAIYLARLAAKKEAKQ